MASRIVDRGLQVIGERASGIGVTAAIQSASVDDRSVAFVAGNTALGSPTNLTAGVVTTSRVGQVISHTLSLAVGTGNFTIRRIALHNIASGSVTGTSSSLVAGIDGISLAKTSAFSLSITVQITYMNV